MSSTTTDAEIVSAVRAALAPGRFVALPPLDLPPLDLAWEEVSEETLFWETFRGRLLSASATRERRRFRAWNVRLTSNPEAEPIISIKRDLADGTLHVTRGLLCYAHETVANGNVIETREVQAWSRELVGSLNPGEFAPEQLQEQLTHLVFSAVVGTGRLPLTSLEAPLPDFTLGRLGYLPSRNDDRPVQILSELVTTPITNDRPYALNQLELMLRSTVDPAAIPRGPQHLRLLRQVFLGVSLSPYTDFVSRALAYLRGYSPPERVDFLSWLLRLQWRHLNAYDLFVFHHRGANYPDALLVQEALGELIANAVDHPVLFAVSHRQALARGWMLRTIYAGHKVPSQPTSPGENLRVMPAPWKRLPDDEIFNPNGRPRELFTESRALPDAAISLIRTAFEEMDVAELGTALLLDRPLGTGKAVGEPDLTPMLAYVARSRKLALRHVDSLQERGDAVLDASQLDKLRARIENAEFAGVPLLPLRRSPRPGVVSLDDAFQTSDDFVIDRTTAGSIAAFRRSFDLESLGARGADPTSWRLILPVSTVNGEVLRVFDAELKPWLDLTVDLSAGYQIRSGVELPRAGLRASMDGADFKLPPKWI